MKIKKRTSEKEVWGVRQLFAAFILILEIILVFTLFDYIAHSLSAEYSVPSWYFTNKIIYGTIIGFVTYLFIKKKEILPKSIILSAVVSILLQIRYYTLGYSLEFVFLFLAIHFIILFIVSYAGFKITKM
jgi:hypothetical protein